MRGRFHIYHGNDLGALRSRSSTQFRLWAPSADAVTLCLYAEGEGDNALRQIPMLEDVNGTWKVVFDEDLQGVYYTYKIWREGNECETQDPYGVACGVNGRRSMVIDLASTNPDGFDQDQGPKLLHPTDAVICEISVADTTGLMKDCLYPGKFLGLTQHGTVNEQGMPTGIDHIRELGVTHVQIMPMYDFGSIDESDTKTAHYNWGYDPVNYNIPEGSYATDPFHGEVRIRECKEMIAAFHKMGIGVIMDVVYNHMFDALESCFEKVEPGCFFRMKGGHFSDASACGNEVASEHPMVRKYIIDSVCYWAKEYHIDGFRFDLMGVLDIESLNELSRRLHKINPQILLYGEGWTGGEAAIPEYLRALKKNVRMLDGIGMFSDDIRDTIRGHVFELKAKGYVSGEPEFENRVRYAVTGSIWHPQVDYGSYDYTPGGPWAENPEQVVSYVSCHDNLTLWDKLGIGVPKADRQKKLAMNRLAAAIVFTSQGIPFFLQGEEFARSKPVDTDERVSENSYNLPIETNGLAYERLSEFEELYEYYRGLIAFRKKHCGLRLTSGEQVRQQIHFLEETPAGVVAFSIRHSGEELLVIYNAGAAVTLSVPKGNYRIYVDKTKAGTSVLGSFHDCVKVPACSCLVAVNELTC